MWPCRLPDGSKVYLVDTPGFDDTYKSDTEILRQIAYWLTAAYESRVKLSGIIYLHRIQDPRVTGTARKNLLMFQKLCGERGLGSVVLATTMWNAIPKATAEQHEAELKDGFWKTMIENGSKTFRHDEGSDSALKIIQYLIQKQRPVTLDIQRDMVDRGLQLNETAAGKVVVSQADKQNEANKRKLAELRKELEDAIRSKDKENQEEIEQLKAETMQKMKTYQEEIEKMKVGREELRRQMDEQYRKEREELLKKIQENERILQDEERRDKMWQERYKKDWELEMAKMQIQFYKNHWPRSCSIM